MPAFLPVTQEQYEKIMKKYTLFKDAMDDPKKHPVSPFDPLSKKLTDELELIREVSKDLQKKKEEDIRAAHAAKAEEAVTKDTAVEQQEKVE